MEDMKYEINRLSDCVISLNERLTDSESKIADLEARPIPYPRPLGPEVF